MYIYVAGPYTQGDTAMNIRGVVQTADVLMKYGYFPYVPHLTHLWHMISPRPYNEWLALDNEWLKKCDAVIRVSGPSEGADAEIALANRLGIPVYYSVTELLRHTCPLSAP